MAKMAKTIDGFSQHQTRLAVVIDGLDSCEQDKVLQMLDTVSGTHQRARERKGGPAALLIPEGWGLTPVGQGLRGGA